MNIHDFELPLHPLLLGPLSETLPLWRKNRKWSSIFLICDENTYQYCAPALWEAGIDPNIPKVIVAAGEQHKHLGTCQQIWTAMFDARLDRHALVLNLGGGVIGDMGGFCAATFKRGVDFLQIPTTLLAATDASVGGKTGIDFGQIKNAVGVFQNPAGVLIDPAFFQTLPKRELHSGFAEVFKHAAIGGPELWAAIADLEQLEAADWFNILKLSIAVKVTVVQEDPKEKGLRAVLNYGHTIGHAIESYFLNSPDPLTHGEAIAWGMLLETRKREARGQVYSGEKKFLQSAALQAYLLRFFPRTVLPEAAFPVIWETMQQDKKNYNGRVRMALPGNAPFSLEWLEAEYKTALFEPE